MQERTQTTNHPGNNRPHRLPCDIKHFAKRVRNLFILQFISGSPAYDNL